MLTAYLKEVFIRTIKVSYYLWYRWLPRGSERQFAWFRGMRLRGLVQQIQNKVLDSAGGLSMLLGVFPFYLHRRFCYC